jgi:type IV pilus assembly protein PilB
MRPEIGYTYSSALRAILRQDPDKILIGEIRDLETASIAIEAALTGHVVFSTLHTNDSPSVIARLLDIGVEPFLVAATLEAALAQRLVRRICVECREDYEPALEEIMELGLEPDAIAGKKFAYGKGCTKCNNTGYRGRCAIYEIMEGTNAIKELVLDQASTQRVREQAREDGMRTLRESGLLAIFDRITTIEEVVRETLMSG